MAPDFGDPALTCPMSSMDPSSIVDHGIFADSKKILRHHDLRPDSLRQHSLRMRPLGGSHCEPHRSDCRPVSVDTNYYSWPSSVARRWKTINQPKGYLELGLLSWNINGRLGLRGCRESLLSRWSKGGFVDVALVQEHFKGRSDGPLYLFGKDWWSVSSAATSEGSGRKSGGCAVLGQPCLSSRGGFQQPGGRICGVFISSGLILNLYFPSRSSGQTIVEYRKFFISFVDELIYVTEEKIRSKGVSWLACGADTNAHFEWSKYPPRRTDDFAAKQVRRFMRKFRLISLAEKICPDRFTFLNSRGGSSCLELGYLSRK